MKLKKLLSAASAAAVMLSALPMSAFAEPGKTPDGVTVPFELTAPTFLRADATPYDMGVIVKWTMNDTMKEWGKAYEQDREAALADLEVEDMWFQPQIDWSIDTADDWKWKEADDAYWLNDRCDEDGNEKVGYWAYTDPVTERMADEECYVLDYLGCQSDTDDTFWYGDHEDGSDYTGFKDVLKEGQYYTVSNIDEEVYPKINLSEHPVYVRMRYVMHYTPAGSDTLKTMTTDWSGPVKANISEPRTKEDLPFELTAPESVHASLTEQEGGQTVQVAWAKNSSMCEWATRDSDPETHDQVIEEYNELGFYELWFESQVDWSVDDTEHWHCTDENNDYWLHDGYDENHRPRLGNWAFLSCEGNADKVQSCWLFRYFGCVYDADNPNAKDSLWYGWHNDDGVGYDGWKDALGQGNYKIVTDSEGDKYAAFDWDGHCIYIRMRYIVRYSLAQDPQALGRLVIASEWSEPAKVNTEAFQPMTKEALTAPEISALRMTDEEFNDHPVFACMLNVPEKLSEAITRVAADYEYGGQTVLQLQARVKGQENWVELQGDIWIKTGEMKFALLNLYEAQQVPVNMPIEVRARYITYQSDDFGDVYSDWSRILEFIKIMKGDVNGDGKINMKDLAELQRYVNGWGNTIVFDAADLDNSGAINMRDVAALQRLINSLPV